MFSSTSRPIDDAIREQKDLLEDMQYNTNRSVASHLDYNGALEKYYFLLLSKRVQKIEKDVEDIKSMLSKMSEK